MKIRDARRRAGLTQGELGARIGLGQSNISRIERNQRSVTLDLLYRIACALAVAPADLIEDQDADKAA